MLRTMRENLKSLSVILWLVIAAFILSVFVTWGMKGQYGGGDMGRNVVATVDGEPIDEHRARAALALAATAFGPHHAQLPAQ